MVGLIQFEFIGARNAKILFTYQPEFMMTFIRVLVSRLAYGIVIYAMSAVPILGYQPLIAGYGEALLLRSERPSQMGEWLLIL